MGDARNRLFVITGGPGAGKTTLIEGLERVGYTCAIEAGRSIIRDQMAIGGRAVPWSDPRLFAELMLCWEIRSYRLAQCQTGLVFFDRGVPDIIGYLRLTGLPVPPHMERAAETFRYNRTVFVAPPWPEIFQQDTERRQDMDEAERTWRAMVSTYTDCGYDLVTVPRVSPEQRVRFIIEQTTMITSGIIDHGSSGVAK